jgi:hypothetical protein
MTKTLLFLVAFALAGVAPGFSRANLSAQAKFDLTGEWTFDVQTDQGGGSPTFVFKQTGDKLAGKYKGLFGEADLTGTVTGKTFKYSFDADAQGTKVTITYEGEFESASSVKGKLDIAGQAQGTFTGKKTK